MIQAGMNFELMPNSSAKFAYPVTVRFAYPITAIDSSASKVLPSPSLFSGYGFAPIFTYLPVKITCWFVQPLCCLTLIGRYRS